MLRVDPRDEADLLWLFNESEGEIKALRSLHAATAAQLTARANCKPPPPFRYSELVEGRLIWHRTENVGFVNGRIYVPDEQVHAATLATLDGRAIAAAAKERRIRRAISSAGAWSELVLRLRYRERLPDSRIAFGYAGKAAQRARPQDFALGVRLNDLRGPGTLAHLTEAAETAYGAARTTLGLARWTDRLGQKLTSGSASPADRTLQREVTRQAERLVLDAYALYRKGTGRIPEIVRRRAQARAA